MRKRLMVLFFIFGLILSQRPGPLQSSSGIGIIIGEPTGLSFRSGRFPILGLAWSFSDYFHFHCDYWINNLTLKKPVLWYWGVGGKLIIYHKNPKNDIGLGLRIPVGLQYFPDPKIEIFAEIVPGILFVPETAIDVDAGIGIRFFIL